MTRNGRPIQPRQIFIARFSCRQCRFTSVDIEGIRHHANSHMLEATINNIHNQRQTEQTRQLRERNLLFNPFRQILPSPAQPARRIPRSNRIQMQRGTPGSEEWRPVQTQLVQAEQHIVLQETQETSNANLMPLIDKLDHPIPIIIDLDSNQTGDIDQFDLTLRL